jgi:excisionase family DNA binding protein
MRKDHQIDNDRIVITLEEAARLLGLHRETVRRLVLTGAVPAVLTNNKGSGKYRDCLALAFDILRPRYLSHPNRRIIRFVC